MRGDVCMAGWWCMFFHIGQRWRWWRWGVRYSWFSLASRHTSSLWWLSLKDWTDTEAGSSFSHRRSEHWGQQEQKSFIHETCAQALPSRQDKTEDKEKKDVHQQNKWQLEILEIEIWKRIIFIPSTAAGLFETLRCYSGPPIGSYCTRINHIYCIVM